jgi:hypothetical protein
MHHISSEGRVVSGAELSGFCDNEELRHRGWTRGWRKRLGSPDAWRRADPFPDPMLSPLWRRSLVESMEATDEWKADRYVNDCLGREIFGRDLPSLRAQRLRQYKASNQQREASTNQPRGARSQP